MGEELLNDMILTNVLIDIYKSDLKTLPKKHAILYIALEEMFHEMKKSNPAIKTALDNSKNGYSELFILQEFFSTSSAENDVIKSYFKWIFKNIKYTDFTDKLWNVITLKGSVTKAIHTTMEIETGIYHHEIRQE